MVIDFSNLRKFLQDLEPHLISFIPCPLSYLSPTCLPSHSPLALTLSHTFPLPPHTHLLMLYSAVYSLFPSKCKYKINSIQFNPDIPTRRAYLTYRFNILTIFMYVREETGGLGGGGGGGM